MPQANAQFGPYVFSALNTASYDSTGIAQGSMFVIFGEEMGPATLTGAPTLPLPNDLAGTSVTVTAGSTTLQCPLFYVSFGQIAAVLPSTTPLGVAHVGVKYNSFSSGPAVPINVVASSIGIFTISSTGIGPGIFTDGLNASLKTNGNSAKPGDILIAWATGAGPITSPDNSVSTTFPNFPGIQVWVGNQSAQVTYGGPSGCCVAVDQIQFVVPQGITGCNVPVVITGGGKSSATATLPITDAGGPCSDTGPTIPTNLLTSIDGGAPVRAGLIGMGPVNLFTRASRSSSTDFGRQLSEALHVKVPPQDAERIMRAAQSRDRKAISVALSKYARQWKSLSARKRLSLAATAAANAGRQGIGVAFGGISNEGFAAALFSAQFPPAGSCVVLPATAPSKVGTSGGGLDAGSSLSLIGAAGPMSLTPAAKGAYYSEFPISIMGSDVPLGSYTLSGTGGADIGPFSVTTTVSASLAFTNKSQLAQIDRTQPLVVSWTGGAAGQYVLIGGYSQGTYAPLPPQITTGPARFICTEAVSKGTFTIPAFVLSSLWPTPDGSGVLFIAPNPLSQPVNIPGLDAAWVMNASSDSANVMFK